MPQAGSSTTLGGSAGNRLATTLARFSPGPRRVSSLVRPNVCSQASTSARENVGLVGEPPTGLGKVSRWRLRQLETAARLGRALATYAVVAWRLLWLTYEARRAPGGSCEAVLPRVAWQVLHRVVHKTSTVPATPPGLREAVRQIARLGGFLARKGDGEPGVKTIWRGLRRLEDLIAGWMLSFDNSTSRDMGNA